MQTRFGNRKHRLLIALQDALISPEDKNNISPYLLNYYTISWPGIFAEYADEKELETLITELTDAAIEKVIPIFDTFKENFKPSDEQENVLLSP